jgi:hypothetical protein
VVAFLDLLLRTVDRWQVLTAVAVDAHLARPHAFVLITAHQSTLPLPLVATLSTLHTPVLFKPINLDTLLALVALAAQRLTARLRPAAWYLLPAG